MNVKPLKDTKIISLACNLPGPLATAELRQRGATVVKVEPPDGDPFAELCPEWYRKLTEKQRVVQLNLKDPREKAVLDELLEKSDVLITSNRPAALDRLGLGWRKLHRLYPDLSQVAIVGYPFPNENLAGHDLTYQASLNLLSPPHLPRTLLADIATAERVVTTVFALLLTREKEGVSGYEQVSIVEAAESFAAPLRYKLTGVEGLLGGKMPAYGIFQTAQNGWIALAALEPHFRQRLANELNLQNDGRSQLEEVFLSRTAEEWKTWATKIDIPLEIIRQTDCK